MAKKDPILLVSKTTRKDPVTPEDEILLESEEVINRASQRRIGKPRPVPFPKEETPKEETPKEETPRNQLLVVERSSRTFEKQIQVIQHLTDQGYVLVCIDDVIKFKRPEGCTKKSTEEHMQRIVDNQGWWFVDEISYSLLIIHANQMNEQQVQDILEKLIVAGLKLIHFGPDKNQIFKVVFRIGNKIEKIMSILDLHMDTNDYEFKAQNTFE